MYKLKKMLLKILTLRKSSKKLKLRRRRTRENVLLMTKKTAQMKFMTLTLVIVTMKFNKDNIMYFVFADQHFFL